MEEGVVSSSADPVAAAAGMRDKTGSLAGCGWADSTGAVVGEGVDGIPIPEPAPPNIAADASPASAAVALLGPMVVATDGLLAAAPAVATVDAVPISIPPGLSPFDGVATLTGGREDGAADADVTGSELLIALVAEAKSAPRAVATLAGRLDDPAAVVDVVGAEVWTPDSGFTDGVMAAGKEVMAAGVGEAFVGDGNFVGGNVASVAGDVAGVEVPDADVVEVGAEGSIPARLLDTLAELAVTTRSTRAVGAAVVVVVTGTEDVADVVDMGVAEGADVVVAGTPVLDERAEVWARSVFADVAAGVATVVGDVAGVEVLDAEVVEVDAAGSIPARPLDTVAELAATT